MTGSRTGGQIVADALVAHGVSHVFGVPPASTMPSATARAEASSTSLTTTDEPTAPKRSAIAWPMPLPAPVTTTTFPARSG